MRSILVMDCRHCKNIHEVIFNALDLDLFYLCNIANKGFLDVLCLVWFLVSVLPLQLLIKWEVAPNFGSRGALKSSLLWRKSFRSNNVVEFDVNILLFLHIGKESCVFTFGSSAIMTTISCLGYEWDKTNIDQWWCFLWPITINLNVILMNYSMITHVVLTWQQSLFRWWVSWLLITRQGYLSS